MYNCARPYNDRQKVTYRLFCQCVLSIQIALPLASDLASDWKNRPQLQPRCSGLGISFDLMVLALASALVSRVWPLATPLYNHQIETTFG